MFRLLRSTTAAEVAARMRPLVADALRGALSSVDRLLGDLFRREGADPRWPVRAPAGLIDEDEVRVSCVALSRQSAR